MKMTTKEFINKSNIIHNNKYEYNNVKYIDSKTNVIITCPKHGDFKQRPDGHLCGKGCNKCSIESLKLGLEEFIIKSNKAHNNKYNYNKAIYINAYTKIIITCPKHGDFSQMPGEHIRGRGCSECSFVKRRSSNQEFIDKANQKHNNKYSYNKTDYFNAKTHVVITCLKHGDFKQNAHLHLMGRGCPKCIGTYHEELCRLIMFEILGKEFYKFKQKTLVNSRNRRLELDCYNEELKINIEYDGIQHYKYPNPFHKNKKEFKIQCQNDKMKDKWCKDNCILNIRIPYTYNTKEEIKDFILDKLYNCDLDIFPGTSIREELDKITS